MSNFGGLNISKSTFLDKPGSISPSRFFVDLSLPIQSIPTVWKNASFGTLKFFITYSWFIKTTVFAEIQTCFDAEVPFYS